MTKRSSKNITSKNPIAALVFVICIAITYGWAELNNMSIELFIGSAIFILGVIVLIALIVLRTNKHRRQIWKIAISELVGEDPLPYLPTRGSDFTSRLKAEELEQFAAQLFHRMGYRVKLTGKTGDHGIDVWLVNPLGQIELVQCKQWNKPVGEREVRDLYGAMSHNQAVRGYIFAPRGFSQAARVWNRGKHIILADEREIGRILEIAYRGQ